MVALCCVVAFACSGQIDDPRGTPGTVPDGVDPLAHEAGFGVSGARRLTRAEYRQTIEDLTGLDLGPDIELLPLDDQTPFDNDYTTQEPSRTLVEAAKALADRTAERVFADGSLRASLLGCEPSGPTDEGCLRSFIERFGRRALRRPLEPSEVDDYAGFLVFAEEAGDFDTAASMVLRAMLQDPELLYRIEIGTPVEEQPRLYRLDDWELATRLSYLLWGGTPDDALLDAAADGTLGTEEGLAAQVRRMLDDPRATARLQRFHAMWLGYDDIPLAEDLALRLRAETDRAVARVVMEEDRPWLDLLTLDETWLDPTLAEHYGLPAPSGAEGWVRYGDTGRAGILSHGSFLSGGAKFGDTSPTLRGKLVRERLLCQTIPLPSADLMVDVDAPPQTDDPDACKAERYFMATDARCATCHEMMDPIGFGLEQLGPAGEPRVHDRDRPECVIEGQGQVVGLGTFRGPAELGALLVGSGEIEACAVEQLHRFVVGRAPTPGDGRTLTSLLDRFRDGYRLAALVEAIATSEAFRYRLEEDLEGSP